MIKPKFAYDPGTGIVDFTPTWPPTDQTPLSPLSAVRHDSVTSSGIKQSVVERIDEFRTLSFANVPVDDMAAWRSFLSYALTGGQFTYYPDETDLITFLEYTLEDTDWAPKRVSWKNFSFTLKMRLFVGFGKHYS